MSVRKILLSAALCASFLGCAHTDRVWRMTPFWGEDLPDPDRVNAWPLFYKMGDVVVVLWPIFDVDDKGFALRPLIAREGPAWSVLFPLSSWNEETGTWWAFPAYNLETQAGLFPLFNVGTWNYAGPVWWTTPEEGEERSWGVFPLMNTTVDFTHVGTAWWTKDETGEVDAWGLFPLVTSTDTFSHVANAWWVKDENGKVDGWGLFPLTADTSAFGHAATAWWVKDDEGKVSHWGVFPLATSTPGFSHVGPVWWTRDEAGKVSRWGLLPIANGTEGFSHVGPVWWTKTSWGVFPLVMSSDLSHVGPVWWREDGAFGVFPVALFGKTFGYLLPAFWNKDENGEIDSLTVLPLVYYKRGPEGEVSTLTAFPFFHYQNDEGYRWLITPLGGRGWGSGEGSTEFVNVLGPIYHQSSRGAKSYTTFAWPLFAMEKDGDTTRTRLLPFFWRRTSPTEDELHGAAGLFEYSRSGEDQSTLRLLPFVSFKEGRERDILDSLTLWSQQQLGEDSSTSALFGIVEDWNEGEGQGFRLFPFVSRKTGLERDTGDYLCLWNTQQTGDSRSLLALLGLVEDYEAPEASRVRVTPFYNRSSGLPKDPFDYLALWSHHKDKDSESRIFLLGLVEDYRSADGRHIRLSPFFNSKTGFDRDWLDYLSLFTYQENKDKDTRSLLGLFGMVDSQREGENRGLRIFPFYSAKTGLERSVLDYLSLVTYRAGKDDRSLLALLGLVEDYRSGDSSHFRLSPFFNRKKGVEWSWTDYLSLVTSVEHDKDSWLHIGTPLLFYHGREGDKTRWATLLKLMDYEAEGDESEFSILYYLYHQKRKGAQVRRDFFPFCTWDSGPDSSGFSFLWRFFRWERKGDKTRGHFLFIPWGDDWEDRATAESTGTASADAGR